MTDNLSKKRKKRSQLYIAWEGMKNRCNAKPGSADHRIYGARGISICKEWKNDYPAFKAWALANGFAPDLSLDRYPDNDGNYEPSNCRWATKVQQIANRRNAKLITHCGDSLTAAQWAKRFGLKKSTVEGRIKMGWPIDEVFSVPVGRWESRRYRSSEERRT